LNQTETKSKQELNKTKQEQKQIQNKTETDSTQGQEFFFNKMCPELSEMVRNLF
jgi:hypothetical protein